MMQQQQPMMMTGGMQPAGMVMMQGPTQVVQGPTMVRQGMPMQMQGGMVTMQQQQQPMMTMQQQQQPMMMGQGGGMMMGTAPGMAMGGGGGMAMGGGPTMGMGMGMGAGMMSGPMESDVFVEVTPVLEPNFNRGPNGTFILQVPAFVVNITTSCNPPPPMAPGLTPHKPNEQFTVQFPDLGQVVYNPAMRQPPNATATSFTTKRGAVLEVPAQVGLNAQLKANSPHGALVLEDLQMCGGMQQKVGENTLHWKLAVEGQLSMSQGTGNSGSHRLEVDLKFHFTGQLSSGGGAAGGQMQMQMQMPMQGGGMMMGGGGRAF